MGRYSIDIASPYDTESFEGIKSNYTWAIKVLESRGYTRLMTDFLYQLGEITCNTKNIDEFVKDAFGQDVEIIRLSVNAVKGVSIPASILISHKYNSKSKNVTLSCDSKRELESLSEVARSCKELLLKKSNFTSENASTGDTINIGDNATITNANIGGKHNSLSQKIYKENFIEGILKQVTAKAIWWWALGLLAMLLSALFYLTT